MKKLLAALVLFCCIFTIDAVGPKTVKLKKEVIAFRSNVKRLEVIAGQPRILGTDLEQEFERLVDESHYLLVLLRGQDLEGNLRQRFFAAVDQIYDIIAREQAEQQEEEQGEQQGDGEEDERIEFEDLDVD